jgi:SAM-dependent methyltransferase
MASVTGSVEYITKAYVDYQAKYRQEPRESDKFMIRLIQEKISRPEGKTLLDIGCHSGNFLYQVGKAIPGLALKGGDLFEQVIEQCRQDPELGGIYFDTMDILDLKCAPVDVITVNAVLSRFDDEQHFRAWRNIAKVLKPGGWVFVFEWYHAFHQTLRIVEETPEHPDGLILIFRSQASVAQILASLGFNTPVFYPFQIGIDLPLVDQASALYTYTQTLSDGHRLLFRGALCQPWCHLAAMKA